MYNAHAFAYTDKTTVFLPRGVYMHIQTADLFDITHTAAAPLLTRYTYPWEALAGLSAFITELGAALDPAEYDSPAPGVWIAKTASVAPGAVIQPPCIIGAHTEIRPGAYIRGSVIVGEGAVVGNSSEVKNAILFDGVQIPHFNYCGDSVLGYKAHFGAGAITSNVKSDKTPVVIHGETNIETGRKKCGAMVGDFVEIGCNSVLSPGTVIGRGTRVYPLTHVRGVVPAGMIVKSSEEIAVQKNSTGGV